MQPRTPIIRLCGLTLLVALLASCARAASPPVLVLASWSDQRAAAELAIKNLSIAEGAIEDPSDFVLVVASASLVRGCYKGAPDEPIVLKVTLTYESSKASEGTLEGTTPRYGARIISFYDHQLTTTLRIEEVLFPRETPPEPAALERARLLQIGPQDALQLTLQEGEAYMGKRVDCGNSDIHLVWDVSETYPESYPELKNVLAPAWELIYYRNSAKFEILHILVDAQTGAILARSG